MTRRIIINIEGEITDETAIRLVRHVIGRGKISHSEKGDFYCWATICNTSNGEIAVYTSEKSTHPNVSFKVVRKQ